MSEEQTGLDIDLSVCCPDASAKADPYYALMIIDDDGNTNGQLWGMNGNLMLFDNLFVAQKIEKAINDPKLAMRGITAAHLNELKKFEENEIAKLFVIVGLTIKGSVEAVPLSEHIASRSKAGSPPPMPPKA